MLDLKEKNASKLPVSDIEINVTIHVVSEGVGVQGFPVTAVRIASNAVRPCLRAVET
jgi:hypothetical protein